MICIYITYVIHHILSEVTTVPRAARLEQAHQVNEAAASWLIMGMLSFCSFLSFANIFPKFSEHMLLLYNGRKYEISRHNLQRAFGSLQLREPIHNHARPDAEGDRSCR